MLFINILLCIYTTQNQLVEYCIHSIDASGFVSNKRTYDQNVGKGINKNWLFFATNKIPNQEKKGKVVSQQTQTANLRQKFTAVDVRSYGAKGDGVTDDTQAFQRAIDAADKSGNKLVTVSKGNYKITNTVTIRNGVTLQGGPKIPFKANFGMDYALISVVPGENNIGKSTFSIEMGAGIKGFSFYWPQQTVDKATPIKYGWAITTSGKASGADNIVIEDIMLTNCYNGINVDHGGQFNIRNIFGQTLNIGIRLDRVYDVSRLENIHFWDFWATAATKAKAYVQMNGEAVVIGRVDGLQATNVFAYGHKTVLHFTDFGHGSAWSQLNNITADVCYLPIQIDKVNIVQLTNVNGTVWDKKTGKSFIETGASVTGEVSITNLNAYLPQTVINIKSTNGTFKLTNITARKRGLDQYDVFQYKVINQSTAKVYIDEIEYDELSGIMQVGPYIKFSSDKDVSSAIPNLSRPDLWSNNSGRVTPISNGSKFDLNGKIDVVRVPVPKSYTDEGGVYIVECDLILNNPENLNPDGQFYLRLTDFTINDVILPGNPLNGYFTGKTHLRVPLIIRKPGLYFDFVYGNNSGTKPSSMELTNLKIYRMDDYKTTRSLIDWLQTKQPNSLHLALPKTMK